MKEGNESGKETRWGRNDDKHLFEALRTVQLHRGFNLVRFPFYSVANFDYRLKSRDSKTPPLAVSSENLLKSLAGKEP